MDGMEPIKISFTAVDPTLRGAWKYLSSHIFCESDQPIQAVQFIPGVPGSGNGAAK